MTDKKTKDENGFIVIKKISANQCKSVAKKRRKK
jgi:hypothetical protein